ncbi:hypothetical protein HMPREF1552_01099 [Leptotrichia sp. oral taxon 879 str. F0557]|nr:hypothetical protein HMPREF1552_01099 [Leptotrichia sp. oral taxon 879 str. F0557]
MLFWEWLWLVAVSLVLQDGQNMKKIEQEAKEDVMKNEVDIFIVKTEMEIVINKSLCEEVEFLRFYFFFAFEEKKKLLLY